MIQRSVFGCASCGEAWTRPLRRLPAWLEGGATCSDAASGTWSLRPDVRSRPDHSVALNVVDVRGLLIHPDLHRSTGCCGVSFREQQPNLVCARCGFEAAYRLSDGDHVGHAVFVPNAPIAVAASDELDDDALLARFSARKSPSAPLPDVGMAAISRRLRVIADSLWNDDRQDPALFPVLHDFAVQVSGREVRLSLDGQWIRPPWPEGERDRCVALGTLPTGLPDDPLTWWTDEPPSKPDRNHWWQWCVDGELCAAWQRASGAAFTDPEAVAFRLPAELWQLAWREALAR